VKLLLKTYRVLFALKTWQYYSVWDNPCFDFLLWVIFWNNLSKGHFE